MQVILASLNFLYWFSLSHQILLQFLICFNSHLDLVLFDFLFLGCQGNVKIVKIYLFLNIILMATIFFVLKRTTVFSHKLFHFVSMSNRVEIYTGLLFTFWIFVYFPLLGKGIVCYYFICRCLPLHMSAFPFEAWIGCQIFWDWVRSLASCPVGSRNQILVLWRTKSALHC